ncbi:putative tricarboxylic transport membrane protein [Rhodobium orientis]|uniref:Tricarboxylate transporter family protein n=1 Tax=Rhodobium orientis TaxID=34017 RepID=A0A327JJX8_9HYPH|nr:tripartite tricarboxylate transporter permease [Rhodobium orientis]MBB4302076.1 putative tricarboxylic transport membrane protein [Rhodobium orientis]MBK5951333.1 Tricarboxylate transporter family protein [Rhodobium orientis]RAI25946.1 Tricarboxylate transporter family protein [Rhodobium orientis]
MDVFLQGARDALTFSAILSVIGGILLGYLVGVLPGLSRPAALSVAVPLTYAMSPIGAIAFLVGVTKASAAGGATGAILLNTPGEPSSAATTFDGYPLAKKGEATRALKVALYASVFGDLVATIILILLASSLARFALKMGPVEMTAVMIFALSFIAALSGTSLTRGIISGVLGLLLATVGLDPESATPRMTFGFIELFDGIPLIAATVGMLAFTEMLLQVQALFANRGDASEATGFERETDKSLRAADVKRVFPVTLRATGIGIAAGIIPGLGPTIGAFLSYAINKRLAKPGDQYGEGDLKGVAATEAADNAVLPASLIPLFAIGLPGSVSAAILVSAFMLHGVQPGPLVFEQHPRLIYGIYVSMIIASLVMLVVGRLGLTLFARVTMVPARFIIPFVVLFCVVGTYLERDTVFSVFTMLALGLLGFVMQRFGYSVITFLIGFVIGPLFELSLRQALIVTNHSPLAVVDHPIALGFLIAAVGSLFLFLRTKR